MKTQRFFLVTLGIVVATGFLLALGNFLWRWNSDHLRNQITVASRVKDRGAYDPRELAGLPAPVARYFAATLTPGQPIVTSATVRHAGTMSLDAKRWIRFRSEEVFVTSPPGFHWDARLRAMPWPAVFVRDAYVDGRGLLQAAIAGLVPVANVRPSKELARGELMRFLAEAPWFPTSLLPSQGVRWAAVDDSSADATLSDRGVEVTLRFLFDDTGGVVAVSTASRPRLVDGRAVPAPWGGRFWNHARRNGMRIPLDAEVAWRDSSGGEQPYWRGHVENASYEFAK